jgi:CopG family nickel-responsive transcriptional regulator
MIVSASLPDELVHAMDELIKERGYQGRSEVIRSALLEFVKGQRREKDLQGQVNAIVVLGYPERLERNLSDLRHQHNDLVKSMLHAHTTRGRCATVLLSEGKDEKMKRFFAELRGLKELEFMDITLL